MLTKALVLATLACAYLNCSIAEGTRLASLADQANGAAFIIRGKVRSVNKAKDSVRLYNVSYLKGCGSRTVRVSGYTSSAACGVDAPAPGDEVVVFVCGGRANFSLHRLGPFTGSVTLGDRAVWEEIAAATREFRRCGRGSQTPYFCTDNVSPIASSSVAAN